MMAPQSSLSAIPGKADEAVAPELVLLPASAGFVETLARVMSPVEGVNGDEVEQTKAAKQFRLLIDPLINPARYPDLHRQFGRRSDLIEHIAAQNGISARTLRRKLKRWEEQQINGLARKIRADKGAHRTLNQAARDFILAAVLPKPEEYGELSGMDVFRRYEEERCWRVGQAGKQLNPSDRQMYRKYLASDGSLAPTAQLPEVSYATVRRFVTQVPAMIKTMARHGDEAYHNCELITHRNLAALLPLDYVVMDHRMLDAMALVRGRGGEWKLVRPWLTAAIDMRTRKWLGWCLVETPSSDSIATVLKQVFVRFGLPKALYWDNGADFRAVWFEGSREHSKATPPTKELPEKWGGVLDSLGVRVHHAIVKRARSKIIEPNFLNLSHFDRTLPEWCGHKPGARPERFKGLLQQHEKWMSGDQNSTPFRTIEEIAVLYSEAIEELNERPHQGDGMRKVVPPQGYGWLCPNEAWELLIPRVARRTVPEEVLQLCFAKRRELTVRNGEISVTFAGKPYHYRLEENRIRLLAFNGRKVELAYDPLDLGEAAVYCERQFLGIARCVDLRRMGESAFVQDERDRRAARREVKRFIKAVHETIPVPDAETHLARRRAAVPVRIPAPRAEVAADIPSDIAAAHSAREADRQPVAEIALPIVRMTAEVTDDEFNFFADSRGDTHG